MNTEKTVLAIVSVAYGALCAYSMYEKGIKKIEDSHQKEEEIEQEEIPEVSSEE